MTLSRGWTLTRSRNVVHMELSLERLCLWKGMIVQPTYLKEKYRLQV